MWLLLLLMIFMRHSFFESNGFVINQQFLSDLIFWVRSSRYTTVNLHLIPQFNLIAGQVEGSTLSKCLREYLHVTTVWQPFPMSSMCFAPEDLGECTVQCIRFLFLQFRREALPQHQHHSHNPLMSSNFLPHQV